MIATGGDIERAFYSAIRSDPGPAGLSALVGERISLMEAPFEPKMPHVVLTHVSSVRTHVFGADPHAEDEVQVDVYDHKRKGPARLRAVERRLIELLDQIAVPIVGYARCSSHLIGNPSLTIEGDEYRLLMRFRVHVS